MRAVSRSRPATLGSAAIALGHTVMVSVMVMTPVHMRQEGATLNIVGLVISVHVFGMYALSPVVGWLADRFGRIPVILLGQLILVVAVVVAGPRTRMPTAYSGSVCSSSVWAGRAPSSPGRRCSRSRWAKTCGRVC